MKTKNLIKISFISCSLIFLFFYSSCHKKEMEHTELAITMTKSVDSVKVNIPATFTFTVTGSSEELSAMTNVHCEVGLTGNASPETITATAGSAQGQYLITKTFTVAGSYDLQFNYVHDGSEMGKKFTITVY